MTFANFRLRVPILPQTILRSVPSPSPARVATVRATELLTHKVEARAGNSFALAKHPRQRDGKQGLSWATPMASALQSHASRAWASVKSCAGTDAAAQGHLAGRQTRVPACGRVQQFTVHSSPDGCALARPMSLNNMGASCSAPPKLSADAHEEADGVLAGPGWPAVSLCTTLQPRTRMRDSRAASDRHSDCNGASCKADAV